MPITCLKYVRNIISGFLYTHTDRGLFSTSPSLTSPSYGAQLLSPHPTGNWAVKQEGHIIPDVTITNVQVLTLKTVSICFTKEQSCRSGCLFRTKILIEAVFEEQTFPTWYKCT